MKLLIQWSLLDPTDWVEIDSNSWANLPKKSLPIGNELLDNSPGWIHQINIQSVIFAGFDHYAIIHGNPLQIICWSDDIEDEPISYFHAREWIFYNLEFDFRLGIYNTKQFQTFYSSQGDNNPPSQNTTNKPWLEFIYPDEVITRHGIWTTDKLDKQHREKVSKTTWQSWTDGVPEKYIKNKLVII